MTNDQVTGAVPRRPAPAARMGPLLLLAGSCTTGPDYIPPSLPAPAAWQSSDATFAPLPARSDDWWQDLQEPELNRLVTAALAANLDRRAAWARIQQARAAAGLAKAQAWPQVDGTASYTRQRTTEATPSPVRGREYDTFALGLDASWELDLFGRIARESEARSAEVGLAEADARSITVSLIAEVVAAYAELRGAQLRRSVANQSVAAADELVQITRSRASGGVGSDLDTARAERLAAAARARLPSQEREWQRAAHRLAVLLGMAPGESIERLRAERALPTVPDVVAVGLPADLVRQRPDIVVAERQLAAATARLGAAMAERYPRLSLSGFFGLESDTAGDLLRASSHALRAGPALRLPLFTGGRIDQQIAVRDAQIDEARAQLEHQVLRAFEEVENAIAGLQQERRHVAELSAATTAAERARAFAEQRFTAGIDDFLTVLDAEQNRLDLADQLAVASTEQIRQYVALHKALGSGAAARW